MIMFLSGSTSTSLYALSNHSIVSLQLNCENSASGIFIIKLLRLLQSGKHVVAKFRKVTSKLPAGNVCPT